MTGAYTFRCPQCGGIWLLEQFVKVAGDVFASFEGVGACPVCGVKFSWTKPGELKHEDWWKTAFAGKKKYLPPHKCDYFKCNNWIEGSDKRLYCSKQCRQNAWYHRNKFRHAGKSKTSQGPKGK